MPLPQNQIEAHERFIAARNVYTAVIADQLSAELELTAACEDMLRAYEQDMPTVLAARQRLHAAQFRAAACANICNSAWADQNNAFQCYLRESYRTEYANSQGA